MRSGAWPARAPHPHPPGLALAGRPPQHRTVLGRAAPRQPLSAALLTRPCRVAEPLDSVRSPGPAPAVPTRVRSQPAPPAARCRCPAVARRAAPPTPRTILLMIGGQARDLRTAATLPALLRANRACVRARCGSSSRSRAAITRWLPTSSARPFGRVNSSWRTSRSNSLPSASGGSCRGAPIRRPAGSHRHAAAARCLPSSSTVFTPVATPTRYPLAVRAALRRPLPCGATAHHPAPALAPVAVRISGRIRSG